MSFEDDNKAINVTHKKHRQRSNQLHSSGAYVTPFARRYNVILKRGYRWLCKFVELFFFRPECEEQL